MTINDPAGEKPEFREPQWWGTISRWAAARHAASVQLTPASRRERKITDSGLTGMLKSITRLLDEDQKRGKAVRPELELTIYEWAKRRHQLALEDSPENRKRAEAYDQVLGTFLEAIANSLDGDPTILDQSIIASIPKITRVVLTPDYLSENPSNGTVHIFTDASTSGIPMSMRPGNLQAAEAVAQEHDLQVEIR
jgi:hypothetical protein